MRGVFRGWWSWLLFSFVVAGPAFGQAPAGAPEGEPAEQPAQANLNRREWIVLMAILGEQLPDEATLAAVTLSAAPADARIRVILPRQNSGALQAELMSNLQQYFATVEPGAFIGPGVGDYVQGEIVLTGMPTLAEYRERRTGATTEPPTATSNTPKTPPPARPTPPPPVVPTTLWPNIGLKRVFQQGTEKTNVVQLSVDGRDRIVREGRSFANNRYKFVRVVPASPDTPAGECIVVEAVQTDETRVYCLGP